MRKLKFFLLTMFALVAYNAAWADDGYLQVGSYYGRGSAIPIYFSSNNNYKCSESETIYKSNELTTAGLQSGDKIYKIAYKGYNLTAEKNIPLQVYLENTTDNGVPSTAATVCNTTNMTQVFDGTTTLHLGGTSSSLDEMIYIIDIELSVPFEYTGNNLRVVVRHIGEEATGIAYCATSDADQNSKYRYKADEETLATTYPSNSRNPIIFLSTTPLSDYQVKLSGSTVPTSLKINQEATFSYTIENKGIALTTDNYTAKFYANGTLVETATSVAIAENGTHEFTFNYTPTEIGTYPVYAELKFADETTFRTAQTMISVEDENPRWSWNVNDNAWPSGVFYNAWTMSNNIYQLKADQEYYMEPTAKEGAIFMTPKLHYAAGDKFMFEAAKFYGTVGDYTPSLTVSISNDGRKTWTTVKTMAESDFIGSQLGGSTSMIYAFNQYNITIEEEGDYYLMFAGAARLDNFYGGDLVDLTHDVMITSESLPTTGEVNSDLTASINVQNLLADAETATAKYYVNGQLIAESSQKTLNTRVNNELSMTGKPHEAGTFTSFIEVVLADGTVIKSNEKEITLAEEVAKAEVIVGTAGGTSTSFPVSATTKGVLFDGIWKSADLATAGITTGTKIKGVVFKGYNTSQEVELPFHMWIGNTTGVTQTSQLQRLEDMATIKICLP